MLIAFRNVLDGYAEITRFLYGFILVINHDDMWTSSILYDLCFNVVYRVDILFGDDFLRFSNSVDSAIQ